MASDARRVIKEGYLSKYNRHNSSIISSWRRRYFRLFEHELAYYTHSQDSRPRQRVELTLDTRVSPTNDQGFPVTCFVVDVPNEPAFYLQAENEEDKQQWVEAIFTAARQAEAPSLPLTVSVDALDASKPPAAPSTPRPERVLLSLTVVEARNMIPVDFNGSSDPYCVISLVGKNGEVVPSVEKKTNYIRNSLNPEWKERFTVGKDVDLRSVDAIQLDLRDYNVMAKHVPLGAVRVPLGLFRMSPASTTESDVVDRWFRIEAPVASPVYSILRDDSKEKKRVMKDHGELHLVMSVSGPNLVEFFQSAHQAMSAQSRVVSAGREHTDNRIEVTILAADSLTTAVETDGSNPFCELSLVDEHGKTLREETVATDRKENTRDPRWKGEHKVFGRVCSIEQASKLRVRVLDFFRKDCLGVATVDLATLAAYDSTEWYPLQLEPGMAARGSLGRVQLRIVMVGETRGERLRRQQMDRDLSTKAHDQSVEQLELENAQHLLHDAACKLDGARIACAANDYQARHPRFYGINGCIQQLNEHISRAHRDKGTSDEDFQARAGIEGKAILEVAVVGTAESNGTNLTAVIAVDPPVCVEASKRTTEPLSPLKRKTAEASGAESRNGMFSKRGQAEVSTYRTKLTKNEVRSEKKLELDSNSLTLVVEVLTGHELHGVDRGGYSDPYCTLTVTDRATGKPIESEKKRTVVVPNTMNPKWTHEVFVFGKNFPLEDAGTLLIHVKDRNSLKRSTPLGRVQIPLLELYRTSIDTATGENKAVEKRYSLTPEPWMDKRAANLGDLCLKTEVRGSPAALNELIQRLGKSSPDKLQGSLSISSFFADANDDSEASAMSIEAGAKPGGADVADTVVSEEIERGCEIRTTTVADSSGRHKWKNDAFSLSLSYPGMFSDTSGAEQERYTLHLRVHGARNLLGQAAGQIASGGLDASGDKDADANDQTPWTSQSGRLRNPFVNAYFTIIPVLSDGRLENTERKQSLTVYDTRSPSWPEQEFVFGKDKGISRISHLSLHIYSRNLLEENLKPVSLLLEEEERKQAVWLKRCFLHKLSLSGEVDDDGLEILQFDQRVLAYRQCLGSGRFYPARVQRYVPLPTDAYEVVFENGIETIGDIRDMFSVDVRAKIATIRKDGKVDVVVLDQHDDGAGHVEQRYKKWVSARQITPVSAFTESVETVMARRIDKQTAEKELWKRMAHKLSGVTIDVLSTSNLPEKIKRPGCIVTLVANPELVAPGAPKLCGVDRNGELTIVKASTFSTSKVGERLSFVVPYDSSKEIANSTQWFQQRSIQLGDAFSDATDEAQTASEESKRALEDRVAVLAESASALIRIVDQDSSLEPSTAHRTIGYAKINFTTLQPGEQELLLRLVPTEKMSYSKFAGSVFVRVSCKGTQAAHDEKQLELALKLTDSQHAGRTTGENNKAAVCGLSYWYQNQLAGGSASKASRLGHRQTLRGALTPTQNAQVDAFHAVLVVIMKRVFSVLREIRLLEEFENLPKEGTSKFRHVHTVSSDPTSEWLGRMINELSLEVRKDIVVRLEMELLDIAAADVERVYPPPGASREEWIKLRTGRQKALQEYGGFMMQDRTTAVVLGLSNCFTGQGMVTWIVRAPPVLWKDGWTKYCRDAKTLSSSLLCWNNPALNDDADAIQAPTNRAYALQWMSALCAAGYVEHASSIVDVVRDFGKKQTLMEDRSDRFYRIREVDMWARSTPRAKSLSPLDLVQELDCHREEVAEAQEPPPTTTAASTRAESSNTDVVPLRLRSDFSKKITPHCEGVLGMPSSMSSLFLGNEAHAVLYPVAEKTQKVTSLNVLCDWKYCLLVPGTKCMYVYENEMSTRPALIIVMTSRACRAAYNFRYDKKGGWFDVLNAALYVKKVTGDEYEPMSAELQEKVLKPRANGDVAIEFKAPDAQLWIQSLSQAGVQIDMLPGQLVVLKQLDTAILQQKCIQYETVFEPSDLEASFQRLLNAFFGHHSDRSNGEQDSRNREMRARIRNELKKTASVGDTIMAYYGKGKRLSAQPANPADFTVGALHSGRIVRIRSPYSDPKYRVSALYDLTNPREAPSAIEELLKKYSVTDKAAWLGLPDALRDLFLLYDVEYDHRHEAIVEEGLLREQLRTEGGDLDPAKVRDRCTDLNLLYRSTDLEDCVTRMVTHSNGKKPLGCLKVPIKMVSPYRVSDTWYSLAPENDMVQKADLGQIRIQLRLAETNHVQRSKTFPVLLEEVAGVVANKQQQAQLAATNRANPMRSIKDLLGPKSRHRRATSATASMSSILTREPSFLKISIKEARNLAIADTFSRSSDPYVQLLLLKSDSDKEANTLMKTDWKSRTLNPKWENQEFTLGKTDLTALRDKKAVILRVMDHDHGSKDEALGCVKLEFQRDHSGYVKELIMHHANADGSSATKQLRFDVTSRVELAAMLFPDERAGQSKSAAARGNKAGEGKLGTLHFAVELTKNENYVDPHAMNLVGRVVGTKTSAEIAFKKIAQVQSKQAPAKADAPEAYDWSKFSVVFQPFGDSEQRIPYDANAEDLSSANAPKLSDVLGGSCTHVKDGEPDLNAAALAASTLKVLGRSYDVTDVAHFEVQLVSESLGKAFRGKFGHCKEILKHPEECARFQDEVIILHDPNNKNWEVHLTVDLHLIGIDRGARIKRVLADSFRIVGLTFDPKTVSKKSTAAGTNDLASFLWDVCKCELIPGGSTAEALMAQVRRMRDASKLHWRFTPQLLWYVFEHVLCHGEKDRVSFANAAALDDILNRWSKVLSDVEEAKSQLVGHLHGKFTPALIRSLFTDCDWTGIEQSPLALSNDAALQSSHQPGEASNVLGVNTRVHVKCAPIKHCSVAVDVRLAGGQFIGATVIGEYDDDHYDVAFCSGAKVKDEEDVYFSDDEDMPPLHAKETVFLCPIAARNSAGELTAQQRRIGTVVKLDKAEHPTAPVLVSFADAQEPTEQWKARGCLDSTWVRVHGSDVHLQLKKDDVVRVSPAQEQAADTEKCGDSASTGVLGRLAKVAKCLGNGKYDVQYLDGQLPPSEIRVPRARVSPPAAQRLYDGIVTRVQQVSASSEDLAPLTVVYDVMLANGEQVIGLRREQIRPHKESFPTDLALLGAVFPGQLPVMDDMERTVTTTDKQNNVKVMADKLAELWRNDQVVKVYVMLPDAVDSISVRDNVTNQLVQARLLELSESMPRFVGQYHGYIKGSNLSKTEVDKLEMLHAAKALARQQQGERDGTETEDFDVNNCFCLLLAPSPRVKVLGCLRLSLKQHSAALFKSVLAAFLSDRDAFTAKLQGLLRAQCGTSLPLNRKERTLNISKTHVCFYRKRVRDAQLNTIQSVCSGEIEGAYQGASGTRMTNVPLEQVSINVRFELLLTPNDRGSMASATADVYDDASRVVNRLKTLHVVGPPKAHEGAALLSGDNVDMSHWHFETSARTSKPGDDAIHHMLEVEFTDRDGERSTDPIVALELVPLDDPRLSVRVVTGKTHELCLPIDKIVAEARLRRHLAPFVKVRVASGPLAVVQSHPGRTLADQHSAQDNLLPPLSPTAFRTQVSTQMEAASVPLYEVKFEKANTTMRVSRSDIMTDALRVDVKEVSQMTLSKKMGSGNVLVEVLLVSSDFNCHVVDAQPQKTPFGVTLSPQGEVTKDLQGKVYPQNSSLTLAKASSSTKWTKQSSSAPVVFRYPSIDLQRVTAVRIVLKEISTKAVIGTTEIPMEEVRRVERQEEQDDVASLHVVSVVRQEQEREAARVVGKMRVQLVRVQSLSEDGHVYAKSLVSENDFWTVDPYELLSTTLKLREDKAIRGLLTSNSKQAASPSDTAMIEDPVAQEIQLRKLVSIMMIIRDMGAIRKPKRSSKGSSSLHTSLSRAQSTSADGLSSPLAATASQFKKTLSYTKGVLEDTAAELGIRSSSRRLPWAADNTADAERRKRNAEVVRVESDLETSTMRLRRTILKLHQLYCHRLVPTLEKLYELDAQREQVSVSRGEQLLRFFEEEVDDLEQEDQVVLNRVHQRLHLVQISQLLSDVMHTTLRVKVLMGSSTIESLVGVAHVPIIDLLDQHVHDSAYELVKPPVRPITGSLLPSSKQVGGAMAGGFATLSGYTSDSMRFNDAYSAVAASSTAISPTGSANSKVSHGKVRLRIKLSFSESSLLEQAAQVYKLLKARYIVQHEEATRRINAAVVPAQRRRWMLLQGYLEQLVAQSKGKLHWEQTPVLLNRVWDVFVAKKAAGSSSSEDTDSDEYGDGLAERVEQYRAAVVEVHTRWANLQPKLDELLAIQSAAQIDAHRTPMLLDDIDRTVEGFDIVLSTALQQVRHKWEALRAALDQLVDMQERNKLHLGLAPQLLKLVEQQCSRGLSARHAEAVAAIQFRWKAITNKDGPLCELRLTVDKGLHWRRTHELLLLLNEQCEGFSSRDAECLEVVQGRWDQVQEWLEKMVEMLDNHVVDCTNTPFLLEKMNLDDVKPSAIKDKTHTSAGRVTNASSLSQSVTVERPSPRKLTKSGSPFMNVSTGGSERSLSLDPSTKSTANELAEDPGRLEGIAEWYAIEEARLELERIPYHRITTDADKTNWLPFSKDGKDTRLLIAEEEMTFSQFNVRAALEDRGVIHKTPVFATGRPEPGKTAGMGGSRNDTGTDDSSSADHSTVFPKEVLEEIDDLERALDSSAVAAESSSAVVDVLANPERVAELYLVIEDLGKTELLWKVKHAVNTNTELTVPTSYWKLLRELELRDLKGYEDVRNLVGSLALMLQKEELAKAGVNVAPMATSAAVKELTRQNNVAIVRLPDDMESIQAMLQERGLDRKGDPVFLRGMRIGTQARGAANTGNVSTSVTASASMSSDNAVNTGLGVIDMQIELLRKSILMEALRKRNSLARTFPVASRILGRVVNDEQDGARAIEEMSEVDMSGDYMTLVERFQQLLIHEAYTKRLASYAALDRCMRGLVKASRDQIVTKEDIALALAELKKPAYRLPVEAFTQEELLEAADAGRIRTPTEAVLARCPRGKNAKAMAYYAAVSYAAAVYQEVKSFRERVDPSTMRCMDSFPLEALATSVADSPTKGMIIPRGRTKLTFRQSMMNWLLGSEESSLTLLQRRLTEYQRQRLAWASAASTLQSRWLQRGYGWCDSSAAGVGVKMLLQRLLLFETANKMHMVATEALLREVDDKCTNLRRREKAAREELERRYKSNYEMLEKLVGHAEKCNNERKLHTEETPALLYAIDQVCVVPHGLNSRHMEAYHVVTFHWLPHRKRLEELVRMHKEGTFSIHRTPELLSAMEYHTEGLAGSEAALVASSMGDNKLQEAEKLDEIRRGQRKMPSTRSILRDAGSGAASASSSEADDVWKPLSPSSRVVQPLSPREKQMSWKVVTTVPTTSSEAMLSPVKQTVQLERKFAATTGGSPRRKSSLGDELKELLLSPSKWLIGTQEAASRIRPEKYFPYALSLDDTAKPSE